MNSRRFSIAVLLAFAVTVTAAAQALASRERDHRAAGSGGAAVESQPAQPSPTVTALVDHHLSLAQLAGQRIVYAYSGLTPPAALLARIRAGEAAGVIFFAANIASRAQLAGVVRELQRANASSPVHAPLLMMTDQEGGEVRRLSGSPALSEKQIGASPNGAALATRLGAGPVRTCGRSGWT